MGGTELNLAASVSSSATAGIRDESSRQYGDFIIGGGGKPFPAWLWLAFGGLALLGVVVWFVRK